MHTAIIIEPRCHRALSFVLNNILTNLSDDWNVVICHGTNNLDFVKRIIETDLKKYEGRLSLRNLGVENLDIQGYNRIVVSKEFHEYIPTEMFLVFQTDSIIIPKYAFLLEAFMKYDYVGAPWALNNPFAGNLGNGGFSLRRKSKMLEIIGKVPFTEGINEDVYFSMAPVEMKKPTWEQAKLFSVEEVYSPVSFGCHAPYKYPPCYKFCDENPEIQILHQLQFGN
jgi:hypothetical protein